MDLVQFTALHTKAPRRSKVRLFCLQVDCSIAHYSVLWSRLADNRRNKSIYPSRFISTLHLTPYTSINLRIINDQTIAVLPERR